jgi:hypothetical protein
LQPAWGAVGASAAPLPPLDLVVASQRRIRGGLGVVVRGGQPGRGRILATPPPSMRKHLELATAARFGGHV